MILSRCYYKLSLKLVINHFCKKLFFVAAILTLRNKAIVMDVFAMELIS